MGIYIVTDLIVSITWVHQEKAIIEIYLKDVLAWPSSVLNWPIYLCIF